MTKTFKPAKPSATKSRAPLRERDGTYKPKVRTERSSERSERGAERGPDRKGARPTGRGPRIERDGRGRNSAPLAVQGDGWICGRHAVQQALAVGRRPVMEVLLALSNHDVKDFQDKHPEIKTHNVARGDLDKMFPDSAHQGMAARVGSLPQPSLEELLESEPTRLIALDQVTDPHNVGAILRSAAAFGVQGMLLSDRRTAGITPVVAKTAAGALETVPIVEIGNLAQALEKLQQNGFMVVGLAGDEGSIDLGPDFVWPRKVVLVPGSEGEGLRQLTRKVCDLLVRIPMSQAMESLNVSVATGVVLSEMYRATLPVASEE